MYLLRFVTLVPHIPERTRISDRLSRVDHQLSQCLRESSVKMSVLPHSFIHTRRFVLMKGPGFWKQWAWWFSSIFMIRVYYSWFLIQVPKWKRDFISPNLYCLLCLLAIMFANCTIFTTLFLGRSSTNYTMYHFNKYRM